MAFLWLIGREPISAEEVAPAFEDVEQLAALLYRRRLLAQVDAEILDLLLSPSSEQGDAVNEVETAPAYLNSAAVAVLVVGAGDSAQLDPGALSDLALLIRRAGRRRPAKPVLAGLISGLGVLLVPLQSPNEIRPAEQMAATVRQLAAQLDDSLNLVAGIGEPASLERASQSYAEARRALTTARAIPDLGPVASWRNLGVFRTLALVTGNRGAVDAIDPRVRRLIADEELARTAEMFLDLAGDVQKTAAEIFVHRTTLYQRLDRIATRYDLDLRRDGQDRLIAHLGFKLARVAISQASV